MNILENLNDMAMNVIEPGDIGVFMNVIRELLSTEDRVNSVQVTHNWHVQFLLKLFKDI